MALDINTIKQASPKANQVATEQYVDTSIAGIDVTQDISANNDTFAQSQGFSSYSDMATKYTALKKTIISGGYINTGLVNANSIVANSISADRLVAGTNSSTVWTGGGLISQNFNGNPYGNIGSPTQGFRLSSNAAGTSADPNIYGAYIKGATLEGASLTVNDVKVKAVGYSNNFGPLVLSSESIEVSSSVGSLTVLTSNFVARNYSSGYSILRMCPTTITFKIVANIQLSLASGMDYVSGIVEVSTDNGTSWINIKTYSNKYMFNGSSFNYSISTLTSVKFRLVASNGYPYNNGFMASLKVFAENYE